MIERLVQSLQALAAPADARLEAASQLAAGADALALDYADALRLVIDCPQIHLDPEQRDALEQLDEHLEALRTDRGSVQWTVDARARTLARVALRRLAVGG